MIFTFPVFIWVLFAIVLFLSDRIIKLIISELPTQGVFLFSETALKIYKNPNLVFSLPVSSPLAKALAFVSIFLIIILFVCLTKIKTRGFSFIVASAFLILGGLSNVLDRFTYGAVLDYIFITNFSAWNIADIMILIGIVFMIKDLLDAKR